MGPQITPDINWVLVLELFGCKVVSQGVIFNFKSLTAIVYEETYV